MKGRGTQVWRTGGRRFIHGFSCACFALPCFAVICVTHLSSLFQYMLCSFLCFALHCCDQRAHVRHTCVASIYSFLRCFVCLFCSFAFLCIAWLCLGPTGGIPLGDSFCFALLCFALHCCAWGLLGGLPGVLSTPRSLKIDCENLYRQA